MSEAAERNMSQEANDHDDSSEGKFSRAEESWMLRGGTGGSENSEGEVLR